MSLRLLSLLLALATCLSGTARAQDGTELVEARVTSLVQSSVFLDQGRRSGIAEGDRVRFYPNDAPSVEGVVRGVSLNNARVELLDATGAVALDTRAEVWITPLVAPADEPPPDVPEPGEPGADTPPAEQDAREEEHPPWSYPPEEWDESLPLLAATQVTKAKERPPSFRGRFYTGYSYLHDAEAGDRDSGYARAGLDLSADNLFGKGGQLRFNGEGFQRYSDEGLSGRDDDEAFRLEHLSYRFGGRREEPTSWQLGRFQQRGVSEFGRIDGVEFGHRFSGGAVVGASVGAYPEPDDTLSSGGDVQAAVSYSDSLDWTQSLEWRLGYQKSWHEGTEDRDLFLFDGAWRPTRLSYVSVTGWLDYYHGDDDRVKDSTWELTRLNAVASHTTEDGDGVRAHYYEQRWPYLLRDEFPDPAEDPGLDEDVTRVGLSVWKRVTKLLRLEARLDHWEDDEDRGLNSELSADWTDVLPFDADLELAVYDADGEYSGSTGVRVGARAYHGTSSWNLSYSFASVDGDSELDDTGDLYQHTLRGGLSTTVFDDWNISLTGDVSFGDERDSYGAGFFLQRRF